jgi:K+-sensing histidine kinase KdpD
LIERVLTNLFDNALRHTPQGGEIELSLRPQGAFIEVTVSDTGPGIAPSCAKDCSCARSTLAAHDVMAGWGCGSCIASCNCTGVISS